MEQAPITRARSRGVLVAAGLFLVAIAAVIGVALLRQPRSPTTSPRSTAPDFEISMYQGQDVVGGEKLRLSQILAKGKPVVLNFFAGLCPPCQAEMPELQKRYDSGGKDRYIMLAVDVGPYTGLGTRADGLALLRDLKITFPAGTVFDEDILTAYQIFGMPSTFFIAPDGTIVRKQIGLLTPDQMDDFIAQLLRASTK